MGGSDHQETFHRKLTRFYIINPVGDRRLEQRFDSREDVVLRVPQTGKMGPAVAYDIGRHGMRLECDWAIQPGIDIEISFPNTPDHMRCFGHVVWIRPLGGTRLLHCGVSIEVWHGIVSGESSWMRVKGTRPKTERRRKSR